MSYNYKNYEKMIIILIAILFAGLLALILYFNLFSFTPFRIENAQWQQLPSLISAHFVGGLNEKRCINLNKMCGNILSKQQSTEVIDDKVMETIEMKFQKDNLEGIAEER